MKIEEAIVLLYRVQKFLKALMVTLVAIEIEL